MTKNNMQGVLFKREQDELKPNAPLYSGNCKVDGKNYRMAGWLNKTDEEKVYLKISFTEEIDSSDF